MQVHLCFNSIGPATYRVPEIIGRKPVISNIKGGPMYSFSKQVDWEKNKNLIISNEHSKHLLHEDVPGVGYYDPDKLKVISKLPSIAPSRAKRFCSASKLMSFKQNM